LAAGADRVPPGVNGVFVGYDYVAGGCVADVGWSDAASSAEKHERADGGHGDDDRAQKKLRVM
ncbi:hypothetical protein JZU56_02285, partial [bacterium]|nr:hypothetical protein [bacterium]